MQAFISDINVETIQNLDLQISQNLTKPNNSTSSVSFGSLLDSAIENKKETSDVKSSEDNSKFEKVEAKDKKADEVQKSEKTEQNKTNSEKVEEKKSEKTNEENSEKKESVEDSGKKVVKNIEKQPSDKTNTDMPKRTVKGNEKGENKQVQLANVKQNKIQDVKAQLKDEKSLVLNKSDEKKISKLEIDYRRMEELAVKNVDEEENNELASYVALDMNIQPNETTKVLNPENDLKLSDETLALSDEVSESADLENFEKMSVLDKDGKIIVKDLRTETENEEKVVKSDKNFTTEVHFDNENTATVTMNLNAQAVEANLLSGNDQVAASNGSNFQAMLNNQIQASAPEFVKTGSIILKNNNQGNINLVLHPDDIGNVKISLSLDGKTISGHIIVNTKEAMEVFKDNAQTLREAFIKEGFNVSNFDVSYNNNSGNGQNGTFENLYNDSEFVGRMVYGSSEFERDSEFAENLELNSKNSEYSINIVA